MAALDIVNPIAPGKAKIEYNSGFSECNSVKHIVSYILALSTWEGFFQGSVYKNNKKYPKKDKRHSDPWDFLL